MAVPPFECKDQGRGSCGRTSHDVNQAWGENLFGEDHPLFVYLQGGACHSLHYQEAHNHRHDQMEVAAEGEIDANSPRGCDKTGVADKGGEIERADVPQRYDRMQAVVDDYEVAAGDCLRSYDRMEVADAAQDCGIVAASYQQDCDDARQRLDD